VAAIAAVRLIAAIQRPCR